MLTLATLELFPARGPGCYVRTFQHGRGFKRRPPFRSPSRGAVPFSHSSSVRRSHYNNKMAVSDEAVTSGSMSLAFPAKKYDAKDYAQLMQLQSIPTVAQVWAKPSTAKHTSAEMLVRIPWRGRGPCAVSALPVTTGSKRPALPLHKCAWLCVGIPNQELHAMLSPVMYLAATVTWWPIKLIMALELTTACSPGVPPPFQCNHTPKLPVSANTRS